MVKTYATNKFIRKLYVLSCFMVLTLGVFGQTQNVSGVVIGFDDSPLPGVNIIVKGTTIGAVTDFDGKYNLEVPSADAVLVFSMMGMLTEEIVVGSQANIDITLIDDLIGLDEVVVVGYGTMKKSDISGSIVSMKEEQLTEVKSSNVLESLQGKAAGVDIQRGSGRTGSDVDILIRGRRSISATNEPLVIVDGIPYGSNIDIDPNDIASIEILKDIASTAIYGSRGANGVILITTKKGKSNQSKIFFNSYYGVSEPYQNVPVFDREGYIQAKTDANRDINNWGTDPDPINVFPGDELKGYEGTTNTNWQDLVTQVGERQNYHLGFLGGTEKLRYNTSLSYYNEKGVVSADEFDRFNFRLNVDADVNKNINVGASSVLSFKEREGRGPRYIDAVLQSPILEAYDSAGNYLYQPNFANPRKSPLAQTYDTQNDRTTRSFSSFYGEIKFLENLSFRSNIGVDLSYNRNGWMYPQKSPDEGQTESGVINKNNYSYTWTNLINYSKEINLHSVNVMLGQESNKNSKEYFQASGVRQDFDRSLWYNLSTNKDKSTESWLEESQLLSYFGRVSYNYNSKYMLNVIARFDGASQLAEENKWDFFPSASAAWRVSGEDFMSNISQINDMKLRVGVGRAGNAAVDPYATASAMNVYPMYVQFGEPGTETFYSGYRPDQLGTKTLKWETTESLNLGMDIGMFENRVVANLDGFWSHTYDLLYPSKLPMSTSYFSVWDNVAETKSKGIELNLSTVNIDASDFKWTSVLTFSRVTDEVVSLGGGINQDLANNLFVGEPQKVYYDYDMVGVWQMDEEDEALEWNSEVGHIKVDNTNGDTIINPDDRKIIGYGDPSWTGSFINTFAYKGFDLTVNIFARMGNMIDADAYAFDPRMYDNQLEIDYWTPENATNDYPRLDAGLAEMDYEYVLRYQDGSFIKIKNITLGYNLPKNLISKVNIGNARIYFSSSNPFILHSNLAKGIDPENGGSYNWPLARTFIFGLNLEF